MSNKQQLEAHRNKKQKLEKQSDKGIRGLSHYRIFDDQKYQLLNPETIKQLFQFFDTDPDVNIAYGIHISAALAGNILFKRKDLELTKESKDWHNRTWENWSTEKERSIEAVGFALSSSFTDPLYGGVPFILDLTQVDVYHWKSPASRHYFRAFERVTSGFSIGVHPSAIVNASGLAGMYEEYEQREIVGLEAFYRDHPPSAEHEIRSRMVLLSTDWIVSDHLLTCTMEANIQRAKPQLVTEQVPDKSTKDDIDIAPGRLQLMGNGNAPNPRHTAEWNDQQQKLAEKQQRYREDFLRLLGSADKDRYHRVMNYMDKIHRELLTGNENNIVELPDQRHLVNPNMPEPPKDFLAFRTARTERVLHAYHLSLSMLSNASSTGHMKAATGQSGRGGSGNNSNARETFLKEQRKFKAHLTDDIKRMYLRIHQEVFFYQAVDSYRQEAWESKENTMIDEGFEEFQNKLNIDLNKIQEKMDLEVSLPGLPTDDELLDWYQQGFITYEYLVETLRARHSLPQIAFNTKPEMTVKEMNGILPPPPPSSSKK